MLIERNKDRERDNRFNFIDPNPYGIALTQADVPKRLVYNEAIRRKKIKEGKDNVFDRLKTKHSDYIAKLEKLENPGDTLKLHLLPNYIFTSSKTSGVTSNYYRDNINKYAQKLADSDDISLEDLKRARKNFMKKQFKLKGKDRYLNKFYKEGELD